MCVCVSVCVNVCLCVCAITETVVVVADVAVSLVVRGRGFTGRNASDARLDAAGTSLLSTASHMRQ